MLKPCFSTPYQHTQYHTQCNTQYHIQCNTQYTIPYTVLYTIPYIIPYTMQCTIQYTIHNTIHNTIHITQYNTIHISAHIHEIKHFRHQLVENMWPDRLAVVLWYFTELYCWSRFFLPTNERENERRSSNRSFPRAPKTFDTFHCIMFKIRSNWTGTRSVNIDNVKI